MTLSLQQEMERIYDDRMMDMIPERLKALLQDETLPLCSCCGVHESNPSFQCQNCRLECYCSESCRGSHSKNHYSICHHHCQMRQNPEMPRSTPRISLARGDDVRILAGVANRIRWADYLVQLGTRLQATCSKTSHFYLRQALKTYLHCLVWGARRIHHGLAAEPRALCLMALLGGDAQLLLDWYSYTSSWDSPENPQDENDVSPAPSDQSRQKAQYPLLALHGLFEQDTEDADDCVFSNMYLLVCIRSLARHRKLVTGFATYKDVCTTVPEVVQDHIASFLWSRSDQEYAAALAEDEIVRVIQHIQEHKRDGRLFLRQLQSHVPLTPEEAPQLLAGKRGERNLDGIPDASALPELWTSYQACFGHTELAEFFLPQHDKEKKD
ncbi:expressed unknown protein [Seminavis robusta]|uniref:MYND-type domain-containing protein n=1 Tax=Seminavis robusta TaxID=568900 RepID=A0A9N8HXV2_9STRA|nr:expressed unknown protein [Seminavis robusta]|eukprot:Sro3371_g347330.1 n/a (383) ;mRNA; f:45-1193